MLKSIKAQDNLYGWLFQVPVIIGFTLFILVPALGAIALAFTKYDVPNPPTFNGLDNFVRIFTQDKVFLKSIQASAIFWILYLIHLPLALLLAVLLNEPLRGTRIFRTIYFSSGLTPMVAVGFVWLLLFHPQFGEVNYLLSFIGIKPVNWLNKAWPARIMVGIVAIWRDIGFPTLILLAALQNVPRELYESAQLDGAGALRRLTSITVPLVTPTLFFLVVMATLAAWAQFDFALIMTQGGPGHATYYYLYHVYRTGFRSFHLGYASALALVLAVIVGALTALNFWMQKKWVFYQ